MAVGARVGGQGDKVNAVALPRWQRLDVGARPWDVLFSEAKCFLLAVIDAVFAGGVAARE